MNFVNVCDVWVCISVSKRKKICGSPNSKIRNALHDGTIFLFSPKGLRIWGSLNSKVLCVILLLMYELLFLIRLRYIFLLVKLRYISILMKHIIQDWWCTSYWNRKNVQKWIGFCDFSALQLFIHRTNKYWCTILTFNAMSFFFSIW